MDFYREKNVLVAGGTGMIGNQLVSLLLEEGANVRIASLDDPTRANPKAEFHRTDLTNIENCLSMCDGMNCVFNLTCTKGSPKIVKEKPASFLVPMLLFNTGIMEAARRKGVERYLFTSSVGVYSPAEVFHEDDVWKTFPSENDRFAGWAKRMGELQAEANRIQYGWDKISIVRPANVYGPLDNFNPVSSMVVPSLIRRAVEGENPLRVWGDGTQLRDIIYCEDVARAMMMVVEKGYNLPVNIGSGNGYTIKEVAETVVKKVDQNIKIEWDSSMPRGDKKRVMDISRATALGFKPRVTLNDGIERTVAWYKANRENLTQPYNIFQDLKK